LNFGPTLTLEQRVLSLHRGGGFYGRNKHGGIPWDPRSYAPIATSSSSAAVSSEIIPPLPQIALITLLSFTLAEILNFCGMFEDEEGIKAKQDADEFRKEYFLDSDSDDDDQAYYKMETKMNNLWNAFQAWFHHNRTSSRGILRLSTWKNKYQFMVQYCNIMGPVGTLKFLSFKHQFGLGCTAGMVFQKIVLQSVNVVFFVYVGSEMLHNLKQARDLGKEEGGQEGTERTRSKSRERSWDNSKDDVHILPSSLFNRAKYSKKMQRKARNPLETAWDVLDSIRISVRSAVTQVMKILNGMSEIDDENDDLWDDSLGTIVVGVAVGVLIKSFT